jgi:hypothetical protein
MTDACFALAAQASGEAGPAHLVLVRGERRASLDRDASLHSGTLDGELRKRGHGEF